MAAPDLRAPAGEAGRIVELAQKTLATMISSPTSRTKAIKAAEETLPPSIASALDRLATLSGKLSYRDGLLVALAHPIVRKKQVDVRFRPDSGRAASDQLGQVLAEIHIKGVTSAYQNIGKNQTNLVRGNQPDWDEILTWSATKASIKEITTAYRRVAAEMAATARNVLARPQPRMANLTFARVMSLLAMMLSEPTEGAHEQYIVSGLLDALVHQESEGLQVETKALNASDRSAGTGGDIEISRKRKRTLLETIEVTANPWRSKISQVTRSMSETGLRRTHLLGSGISAASYDELKRATDLDVSILDPLDTSAVIVALLDRRGREYAIVRLYELLDRYTSAALVNRFVRRLWDAELAEQAKDIPGAP